MFRRVLLSVINSHGSFNNRNVTLMRSFTNGSWLRSDKVAQSDSVVLYFVMPNGKKVLAKAKIGSNLLDVVIDNNVDIDGFGACEGTLACSTCHLIFSPDDYNKLPKKPIDEELDMLDLAYGLTSTSRLGCQIEVFKEMAGWEIKVPEGLADIRTT